MLSAATQLDRPLRSAVGVLLAISMLSVSCFNQSPTDEAIESPDGSVAPGTGNDDDPGPAANPGDGDAEPESERADSPGSSPDREPEVFVPAGPVGDSDSLRSLIERLSSELPAEFQGQVPWPDLGNPDPVQAQLAIFDLWIWMAANHPDPALVELMAAPGSESRTEIAAMFGELNDFDLRQVREAAPYEAFDHRAFTLDRAGLPLWLTRDVPDDAVVVYYSDRSGPITLRDGSTDAVLDVGSATATRRWLSILVPTEIGWLLFRDQLIEIGDPLEPPESRESPLPGAGSERLRPQL